MYYPPVEGLLSSAYRIVHQSDLFTIGVIIEGTIVGTIEGTIEVTIVV